MTGNIHLARLLQLASPALPVGAYSYSQGLEAATEAGLVRDAASAQQWISDVLEIAIAHMEGPVLLRLHRAWRSGNHSAITHWNELFLASRETAELRAETLQMGYSLARLLGDLNSAPGSACDGLRNMPEIAFPTAYACASADWNIPENETLIAYLWGWLENQVMAGIKVIPLGQTSGQKILLDLGGKLPDIATQVTAINDDDMGNFAPGLALLSCNHETQYSRIFRS